MHNKISEKKTRKKVLCWNKKKENYRDVSWSSLTLVMFVATCVRRRKKKV
jgi:hypothetical protein